MPGTDTALERHDPVLPAVRGLRCSANDRHLSLTAYPNGSSIGLRNRHTGLENALDLFPKFRLKMLDIWCEPYLLFLSLENVELKIMRHLSADR